MNNIKDVLFNYIISLILKIKISKNDFYKIVIPKLKKLSKSNNIPLKITEKPIYCLNDEIIFYINYPYLKILCNHKYYDGSRLTEICELLNENKKKIKNNKNYINNEIFTSIISNEINNQNFLGKLKTNKIFEFKHPIRTNKIIDYMQNYKKNSLILLLKKKNINKANNFDILCIEPNETFDQAIKSNKYLNYKNALYYYFMYENIIFLNLYHKFSIPYFCEKIIFPPEIKKNIFDLIFSKIIKFILLPKNSRNLYELYSV